MTEILIFLGLYIMLGLIVWFSFSMSKMFTKTNPLIITVLWPWYVYLYYKKYRQ